MEEKKVREDYLEFPWGIEDTIENLRELKSVLQRQVRETNCDGKGAQDAFEVGFDFDRAIEALEKQLLKKPIEYEDKYYVCPDCGNVLMCKWEKYPTILEDRKNGLPCCLSCLQAIDWSES